ncbi:MAG: hypothetical protein GF375_05020 [Candidatus Omnitrophica bacterium]|nr:hypothetical protein [Candidatus Omnitrophota bacterium]
MKTIARFKHIYIDEVAVSDSGKTSLFAVMNKSGNYPLAEIKWYGPWRQYCFFPLDGTVWNNSCLRDVLGFINRLMRERKNERK